MNFWALFNLDCVLFPSWAHPLNPSILFSYYYVAHLYYIFLSGLSEWIRSCQRKSAVQVRQLQNYAFNEGKLWENTSFYKLSRKQTDILAVKEKKWLEHYFIEAIKKNYSTLSCKFKERFFSKLSFSNFI